MLTNLTQKKFQFIEKEFKETETFGHSVMLLLFLFTLEKKKRKKKRKKEEEKILLHQSGPGTDLSGDSAAVCRHIVGEDGVCFIHLPDKVFDV